jgi:hypothetical protein
LKHYILYIFISTTNYPSEQIKSMASISSNSQLSKTESSKTEDQEYEPLYTDIVVFGAIEHLAMIKRQYKNNYRTLAIDWRKTKMEGWALEEWRWELVSRETSTFQLSDGSTLKFGEVTSDTTNKDSPHYLSYELSKRVIMRLTHKFTPANHRLFYWWLKDIEDSKDGQEFVLAIKILCSNECKKTTINQTIQWLRTFFHTRNPPYE